MSQEQSDGRPAAHPEALRPAALAALVSGAAAEFNALVSRAAAYERSQRSARRAKRSRANDDYMSQRLSCHDGALVDASGDAVMMDWERDIMEADAAALAARLCACAEQQSAEQRSAEPWRPRVLNIGFGLGLFDSALQRRMAAQPFEHTIVEAHPDVLAHARAGGWEQRPGVRLLASRWQRALPELVNAGERFDAIYYDTYAESYAEMRGVLELLPALLRDCASTFAYFNGGAAACPFFHAVYCRIAQLDVSEIDVSALDIAPRKGGSEGCELALGFSALAVDQRRLALAWERSRRKYWRFETYLAARVTCRAVQGEGGSDTPPPTDFAKLLASEGARLRGADAASPLEDGRTAERAGRDSLAACAVAAS